MKRIRKYWKSERLLFCFAVALFFCCTAALSFASTIDLPQTGQTTCYDASGNVISCTDTGQDGDWRAGVTWPGPRFVSGTGAEADCMKDKLTGLMWPKNGNHGITTWQGALDTANGLNLCGHTDWRLPNIVELRSLINDEEPNNATWLNSQGFNNVQSYYYWSSSTVADYPYSAWVVYMDGYVYGIGKAGNYYVWPVRAGQSGSFGNSAVDLPRTGQTTCYNSAGNVIACAGTGQDGDLQMGVAWQSPRFTVSGDCVTDNLTGLMWPKDANRFGSQAWQAALDSANNLNLCGYTDWRLPNVNELRSVVDYSNYYPALPDSSPFINVQLGYDIYYWSSSTRVGSPDHAWLVDMGDGYVVRYSGKGYNYYVWPVRAGLNRRPVSGALTPSSPASAAGTAQTFKAVYKDADGFNDLKTVDLLVSRTGSRANAIWVRYFRAANKLRLYNNAGTQLLSSECTPGVAGSLQNSQGKILCGATTVTGSDDKLIVRWRILPKAAFADALSPRKLKMNATDKEGSSSHWKLRGSWTIQP